MYPEKSQSARGRRPLHGFTLVELLVVVTIIALLVGILVPSVSSAIKQAADARTSARVAELAAGCIAYHGENDYYPGQRHPGELTGSGGSFTGSQWLARTLFSDFNNSDIPAAKRYPQPNYAPVKDDDLVDPKYSATVTIDGSPIPFTFGTISDRNTAAKEVMPILYYPARLGASGMSQYLSLDNTAYTSGHTGSTSFGDFIRDERYGSSTTPYNPGAFLIIAAGKDRLYFTSDDIRYPAFKSD